MSTSAPLLLDRATPVPLHHQVSEALRGWIAGGRYRAGDLIPPETVLATELGLSRATVRQGIATLVAEGLLSRRRGIGTTVATGDLEQPLRGLYTIAGLAAESGRELTTRLLDAGIEAASVDAAARLELHAGADEVVRLERLRLLDQMPLVVETVYLPHGRCGRVLRDTALDRPLYDLLEEYCGITVTGAREQIRPVRLAQREAALLEQPVGAAAFQVDRIGLAGVASVEWRRSLIRGDRFVYSIELTRGARSPLLGQVRDATVGGF